MAPSSFLLLIHIGINLALMDFILMIAPKPPKQTHNRRCQLGETTIFIFPVSLGPRQESSPIRLVTVQSFPLSTFFETQFISLKGY